MNSATRISSSGSSVNRSACTGRSAAVTRSSFPSSGQCTRWRAGNNRFYASRQDAWEAMTLGAPRYDWREQLSREGSPDVPEYVRRPRAATTFATVRDQMRASAERYKTKPA
jgi:hypothetical protein